MGILTQVMVANTKITIFRADMPQDTLYIINNQGDTIYTLTDTATRILKTENPGIVSREEPEPIDPTWPSVFVVLLFVVVFSFRGATRYISSETARRKERNLTEDMYRKYHLLLLSGSPYYRKLSAELRRRFIQRTYAFMLSKDFHYVELVKQERIPFLISAVAVQITFGLNNYLLDYFRDIYIMRTNYHFGLSGIPFEGHVNSKGIYLSWNNFEKSFHDYADGNNVGLHEMAHALTYVNFTAKRGVDNYFSKRFKEFSKTGRRIFNEMQSGKKNMLGSYAATNYHEFWAVCIENFFERSQLLKIELPDLYLELTMLLKQDPLSDNLLMVNEKQI